MHKKLDLNQYISDVQKYEILYKDYVDFKELIKTKNSIGKWVYNDFLNNIPRYKIGKKNESVGEMFTTSGDFTSGLVFSLIKNKKFDPSSLRNLIIERSEYYKLLNYSIEEGSLIFTYKFNDTESENNFYLEFIKDHSHKLLNKISVHREVILKDLNSSSMDKESFNITKKKIDTHISDIKIDINNCIKLFKLKL